MTKLNVKRKLVSVIICMVFTVSLSVTVLAAPYSQKLAKCTRCKQYNSSYGYSENYNSRTVSVKEGEYCDGCKKTVPVGEYHMYIYTNDLYYFRCDSKNCSKFDASDQIYKVTYANAPSEHYINGKRDY